MGNQAGNFMRDVHEAIDTIEHLAENVRIHLNLLTEIYVSGTKIEIDTSVSKLNSELAQLVNVTIDAQNELVRVRY